MKLCKNAKARAYAATSSLDSEYRLRCLTLGEKKKKRRAIISLAQDTSGYGSNIHVAEQLPSLLVIHKHDEKLTLFLQATYAGISNLYLQANGIRVLSCHRHDIESTFQFYSYKIMRTLEY